MNYKLTATTNDPNSERHVLDVQDIEAKGPDLEEVFKGMAGALAVEVKPGQEWALTLEIADA